MSGDVLVLCQAVDVDGNGGGVGTQVLLQFLALVKQPQRGAWLVEAAQLVAFAEILFEVGHESLCEIPAS